MGQDRHKRNSRRTGGGKIARRPQSRNPPYDAQDGRTEQTYLYVPTSETFIPTGRMQRHIKGSRAATAQGAPHFEPCNLEVDRITARRNQGTDHIDKLQLLCGRAAGSKETGALNT